MLLEGETPATKAWSDALYAAVCQKRKDIVLLLLDQGADINGVGVGKYGTALAAGASSGNTDIMLLLLERGANINMVMGEYGTALAAAASSGKMHIVSLLLDRGADINKLGGKYGTVLAAAAYYGHTNMVMLLLERGADIDMVMGEYGTALAAASHSGNTDTVSLLLDRGSNINMAVGGRYGTALAAAAFRGNMHIVLLLLDRGANINMVSGRYGTALATAAVSGNMHMVSLLLDRGADINMVTGGDYGTALATAVSCEDKHMVSLLLKRGANINMIVGGKYGTALAVAVYRRKYMVSLLLDRGADVNLVISGGYGTALTAAANRGDMDIMSLLLRRGADINMGGEYGTVLAAAAYRGDTDTVSLLLYQEVEINKYGAALAAAAHQGKKDTLSLLLDRGADVNMVVGEYGTVLAGAAFHGNKDTVSLLLYRGANINMVVGGEYGSALAAAAYRGDTDIVLLLLYQGADINLVGGEYGSALAAAACSGGMGMVSLLLDRGADINMVGGEYGSALAAAAFHGNKDTVPLLLDRGADIDKVGGVYGTALAAAIFRGNMKTMSLLLDRGADINTAVGANNYGTALAVAALRGYRGAVSLLLDRGADINMVGGGYGTALGAAVFKRRKDMVTLLVGRGADINLVSGESGTALGQAIHEGSTEIALLLLELGADVMRVGGSYPTTFGVYPSALDVAHLDGSNTDPALVAQLETAVREQSGGLISRPEIGTRIGTPVDDVVSRPPFPMPYPRVPCANLHNKGTSLQSPTNIPSTQFRADSNITPEQADVPCQELNEETLWSSLVELAGLHEDIAQAKYPWIQSDVRYFVACNYDLGLAYAAVRVAWSHFKHSADSRTICIQRSQWHKRARLLGEARSKAIKVDYSSSSQPRQELIISPYSIMPRRLWDLKSNRVVDFRMLHAAQSSIEIAPTFWAVTHSWTSDMSPVWTSINQHQWPVPLPKDINLETLRSELLTFGAEYVWIDVLCLRQQSKVDYLEQLRQEEWKLDVPTIGNIYRAAKNIVRYFNGLGVRFSNEGWGSSRHWLQRAWTLQEIADENATINGGIPRDRGKIFLDSQGEVSGKIIKLRSALRPVIQLAAQVDSQHGCDLYELAQEMSRRNATQLVDKLAGLFYLLRTTKLPCYDEKKTSEDIWGQCFHLLPSEQKTEILLNFPYRGSDEQWFPTWAQVLDWPVRDPEYDHKRSQISQKLITTTAGEVSLFISDIWTLPDAILSESDNAGQYEVKIGNLLFGFYQPYLSQRPINIQDPVFTLAIANLGQAYNWVVCKALDRPLAKFKVLKKVGVIRTDSSSELLVGRLLQKRDCFFV